LESLVGVENPVSKPPNFFILKNMKRTKPPTIQQPYNIDIIIHQDANGKIISPLIKFNFILDGSLFPNQIINVPTYGRAGVRPLKEKKHKKESSFFLLLNMFDDNWKNNESFQKSIQDFIIYRKQKGKSLTPLACKRFANHLSKYKLPIVIQAIEKSIINGWTGVFPESIESSKNTKFKQPYKDWEGRRFYLCPDGEYRQHGKPNWQTEGNLWVD
jgi:hypothetical protein